MQHPCGVTNATRIEGHLDNLLFDRRRLPRVAIVQQEGATGTALLAAAVPLLALPGLAMADNIRAVTVGTVEDLEHHDATRSRWGYSALETLRENSTSTPVRHLPLMYRGAPPTPLAPAPPTSLGGWRCQAPPGGAAHARLPGSRGR